VGHEINGELASWQAVAPAHAWSSLLVGNGFSAHLWRRFHYASLFAQACEAGHLDPADEGLFEAFQTENFERVLSALSTSITVARTLGESTDDLYERYASVQDALGGAVRHVHPRLEEVPYDTREAVRRALAGYKGIYATSYDLLLYWCMGAGSGGHESFHGFKDYFWAGGRCEFDPADTTIMEGHSARVVHLHGALHLVVNGEGVTRKRTFGGSSLLDQIGQLDPDEPQQRPLLISEGSAVDKLRAIQENDYLSFALTQLREATLPMVVFGHSLSPQDAHLIEALNRRPERPMAISIRVEDGVDVLARQAHVRHVLKARSLYFFDAATHPLGLPEHCIPDERAVPA